MLRTSATRALSVLRRAGIIGMAMLAILALVAIPVAADDGAEAIDDPDASVSTAEPSPDPASAADDPAVESTGTEPSGQPSAEPSGEPATEPDTEPVAEPSTEPAPDEPDATPDEMPEPPAEPSPDASPEPPATGSPSPSVVLLPLPQLKVEQPATTPSAAPQPVVEVPTPGDTPQPNQEQPPSEPCPDGVEPPCTSLRVIKNSAADPVNSGEALQYSVRVINAGPFTATEVTLIDDLPAPFDWTIVSDVEGCSLAGRTLSCSAAELRPRASIRVGVTAVARGHCGKILNTGRASAANALEVSNRDSITILCPRLAVRKTADDNRVDAGDRVGFGMTVTNNGRGAALDVVLTDPLPAGFSWVVDGGSAAAFCSINGLQLRCALGRMSSGATASVHVSSATDTGDCDRHPNTVTVAASNHDPVTDDDATRVDCETQVGGVRIPATGTGPTGWRLGALFVSLGGALLYAARRREHVTPPEGA